MLPENLVVVVQTEGNVVVVSHDFGTRGPRTIKGI